MSVLLQIITILFGIVFLVNKYFEWTEKIFRGIYPNSPVMSQQGNGEILFFSLYYVMTGIHGLHVLIGIIVIAFMAVFTRQGSYHAGKFFQTRKHGTLLALCGYRLDLSLPALLSDYVKR